ncbi:PAS domain-containing protein [Methylonatrum kenyense]|uniref:PAS domain-containing protein n=1 Tax=Methylonatrum kenyense TaxID=455253 RepID=UPI0020BED6B7|nr:PAS domain-containing protein [Methylonatrum kenyense]MCK8515144.1 PAS domain-containing protein [Methylonatrum kenyense]
MAVKRARSEQATEGGQDPRLALLDLAERAALLVGPEGILAGNETACRLLGVRAAQIRGRKPDQLLEPLQSAPLVDPEASLSDSGSRKLVRCRSAAGQGVRLELRVRNLEPGRRWPQIWMLLPDGALVTEATTEHAHRLQELMSHLPSVLYRSDNTPSWTMRFISDGCRSLTGYDEDQLLEDREISYLELIHPEDRGRVWNDIQQALREFRPFRVSYRIRTALGAEKWVWEQGVGVYGADNRIVAVEGFITDITARKRTEDTLSSSQQALARLLSNLPGMAYRCRNEPDWMFEFVSDGCVELTGYLSSELVQSRTVAYGDLIVAEDRERVWQEVQQGVQARKPFASTYRIIGADGGVKWVWDRGNGVYDARGSVIAIEGFVCDVTEVLERRSGT